MKNNQAGLSTIALMLLIAGAIDSIRNLPATALFGNALPFFFILAALFFLIPTALISAVLSSASSDSGGIFHWVKTAFGEKIGFFAIWLQWINTMVWFPTILSFIAGTFAYLIDPALALNKLYLVSVILTVFWAITLISVRGFSLSVKFANFCVVIGMVIPIIFIMILGIVWIVTQQPLHIALTPQHLLPSLHHTDNWISLTAIIAGFLGMELATVHVQQVNNPQKTFPRALGLASLLILVTMLLGALTIAIILPASQINLVNGVMETFANFFALYHLQFLTLVLAGMILLGSLGQMVSWVISPAKGLLQSAQMGYLPHFMTKLNHKGVASRLLIAQAILVSLICLAFLLMPSVNGSYWLLTDLSTQLYVMMYILMFLAAWRLQRTLTKKTNYFTLHRYPLKIAILMGILGCLATFVVGFIPPDTINTGGFWHYEIIFVLGLTVMLLPVLLFFYYQKFNGRRKNVIAAKTSI